MSKLFTRMRKTYILACPLLGLGMAQKIDAATENTYAKAWKQYWTEVNQYSPADTFESQGSYGFKVGLGILKKMNGINSKPIAPDTSAESELGLSDRGDHFQRLVISHGTRWPVDFGIMLAQSPGTDKMIQWGFHSQWTIFEAFQLPTVGIRISRLTTSDRDGANRAQSDSLQLGTSYAVIRYVTLSFALGIQSHSLPEANGYGGDVFLREQLDSSVTLRTNHFSWGISLRPLTESVRLNLEQSMIDSKQVTNMLKLSFHL